jgi:hypothetical protein
MRRQCPESGCVGGARPSASDALDGETWELCRGLPLLPEPEPELVCRERDRERKAPLIRAREVVLPLREPRRDAQRDDSAKKTVEKVGRLSLRARTPQASHQTMVFPSGMRGRPRGQREDFRVNALTQLLTVSLERLSLPRCHKTA